MYNNEFEQREIKFKPRINLNHNIIFIHWSNHIFGWDFISTIYKNKYLPMSPYTFY